MPSPILTLPGRCSDNNALALVAEAINAQPVSTQAGPQMPIAMLPARVDSANRLLVKIVP